MSQSGRKRPVLVADKRYPSSSHAAKTPAAKKTTKKKAPKRAPAPKRGGGKNSGGSILMWPVHLVMWILRLMWRLMWKGAIVVA